MSLRLHANFAALVFTACLAAPGLAQEGPSEAFYSAYQAYASAHAAAMSAGDHESYAAAMAELGAAQADLNAQCADLGFQSLAECLDTAIPANARQPGDLDAVPPPPEPAAMPEEPVAEEPVVQEPVIEEPVVEEPAPEEPVVQEPVVEEPAVQPEAPPAQKPKPETKPEKPVKPGQNKPAAQPVAEEPVEPTEPGILDVAPEDIAPVLDSAKEEPAAPDAGQPVVEEPAAPPPLTDEEAQSTAEPIVVESPTAEKGEVIEKTEVKPQAKAPKGAKVVNQSNFGIVFQFNNQLVIQNRDEDRMRYQEDQHTVEQLRNGRIRETVYRQNGDTLITIYNANGDIVRRSLIDANGNEHVLVYVPEQYQQQLLEWRDPGQDLPPLRLNVPVNDYILDASRADPVTVRNFLAQPPIEQVRRLYSVNEVKRSARIRDTVRRLELSDLSFDSGSASLRPDQFGSLEIIAQAMSSLLRFNPAETFLIEGHTDAVGTELANLELSDRRAETIAIVLTEYFGIPPENLATQGYGERYLKIRTEFSEPRNRRVTFKRITPLVSPYVDFAG